MPRSMGRANRINHRTSHVTVVVTDEEVDDMGQKTHPIGFRLGIIKTWTRKWYEEKNYAKWLHEDIKLKEFIKKKLDHAGVAYVEIERAANKAKINIHTARPGIVIGKRGAGVETLKKEVQALTENEVFLNIIEVRKAETNAQLVAENIATQLERRIAFRRAMKKAVADRDEVRRQGHPRRVVAAASAAPRWRAASGTAKAACRCTRCAPTSSTASPRPTPPTASIGVKCWIFKGEVLPTARKAAGRSRAALR